MFNQYSEFSSGQFCTLAGLSCIEVSLGHSYCLNRHCVQVVVTKVHMAFPGLSMHH